MSGPNHPNAIAKDWNEVGANMGHGRVCICEQDLWGIGISATKRLWGQTSSWTSIGPGITRSLKNASLGLKATGDGLCLLVGILATYWT